MPKSESITLPTAHGPRTDQPTDGQALLWSRFGATKSVKLSNKVSVKEKKCTTGPGPKKKLILIKEKKICICVLHDPHISDSDITAKGTSMRPYMIVHDRHIRLGCVYPSTHYARITECPRAGKSIKHPRDSH